MSFTDGSTDPDGDLAAWSWTFGDGTGGQGPDVSHTYTDDGSYTVTLTVTDQAGHEDTTSQEVVITNRPPAAGIRTNTTTASPGQLVGFEDASVDTDGTVVSRVWRFGDGDQATARDPEHAYARPGTYTVSLTVTDDDGASDQAQLAVEVVNQPPRIEALELPGQAAWYERVHLEPDMIDPEGGPLAVTWNLGDGSEAVGRQIDHVYRSPGTYTVTVTAIDRWGASTNASAQIEIVRDPSGDGGQGTLQPLVDRAEPGQRLLLPAGSYREQVRVDKPLTLEGRGEVTIDGGSGPALRLTGGPIEVRNLTLASSTSPVVGHDAPTLTLWNVTTDGGLAPAVVDVGWLRWVVPVDQDHSPVEGEGSNVEHSHPLQLRTTYEDGTPRPGSMVEIQTGGGTLHTVESGPSGHVGTLPVPHRWTGPDGQGTNRTVALVDGGDGPIGLDPHAGVMVIAAGAPPSTLPVSPTTVAVAALVAMVASAAVALRVHEGFRRWIWGLIAPLYTRLARTELLDHETREAIHDHLEEQPGAHLRAIKRELGLAHGTLLHHLKMLEDQGLIRSVKDGMYRRFYLAGEEQVAEPTASTRDRVAGLIFEHPGITNEEIARRLETQPNRTHYHVSNLLDDGEIRRRRDGRKVRLYPEDPGAGDG